VILLIDNYDSFTYNLVQLIGELDSGSNVRVIRNDAATVDEIDCWNPRHVIISPGPCTPNEAGVSVEVVRRLAGRIPILGVCLGHQCVGQAFGGHVVRAGRLMHGKTSQVSHVGTGIYEGLVSPFVAARYHSLVLDRAGLPGCLEVTAWTDTDELMGVRHTSSPVEGVQFHPESFLTTQGARLVKNFLNL